MNHLLAPTPTNQFRYPKNAAKSRKSFAPIQILSSTTKMQVSLTDFIQMLVSDWQTGVQFSKFSRTETAMDPRECSRGIRLPWSLRSDPKNGSLCQIFWENSRPASWLTYRSTTGFKSILDCSINIDRSTNQADTIEKLIHQSIDFGHFYRLLSIKSSTTNQ